MPTRAKKPAADLVDPRDLLAAKATAIDDTLDRAAAGRPAWTLEPELDAAARRLVAAKAVASAAAGHLATAEKVVKPALRALVLKAWIAAGRKLANPLVSLSDNGHLNFLAKDTCRVVKMGSGEAAPRSFPEHLEREGVPADLIDLLTSEREYKEETVLTIDLAGVERDKPDLYARLCAMLAAANTGQGLHSADGRRFRLSNADLAALLKTERRVSIADGFLERAPRLAQSCALDVPDAVDRLDKLLAAIPPQWVIDHPFCGAADPHQVLGGDGVPAA